MSTDKDPVGGFFAWLLIVVGGLVAFLSGACTLVVIGAGVLEGLNSSAGENLSILFMVVLVGGIPFAVGAGLFLVGRSMLKNRKTAANL